MDEMEYRKSNRCYVILVVLCVMIALVFGNGVMGTSVFLKVFVEEWGVSVTSVSLYFTIMSLAGIVGSVITPRLLPRNTKLTVGIAGIVAAIGFFVLALFPGLPALYLAGALFGLAVPAAAAMTATVLVPQWFYSRQGFYTGVALSFTGVGGILATVVFTALIPSIGYQPSLMVLGALIFIGGTVLGVVFLTYSPLEKGLLPHGATAEDIEKMRSSKGEKLDLPGLTAKQYFKNPFFVCIALVVVIAGFIGCVNSQANLICQVSGFTAVTAGLAASTISFGNIFGKFVLGAVRDKRGAPACAAVGAGFVAVGIAMMIVSFGGLNVPLLAIGGLVCGLGSCMATLAAPMHVLDSAGPREYGNIVGIVSVFGTLGSAAGQPIIAAIYDSTGSYIGGLVMLVILAIIMIPLSYLGVRKLKSMWQTGK